MPLLSLFKNYLSKRKQKKEEKKKQKELDILINKINVRIAKNTIIPKDIKIVYTGKRKRLNFIEAYEYINEKYMLFYNLHIRFNPNEYIEEVKRIKEKDGMNVGKYEFYKEEENKSSEDNKLLLCRYVEDNEDIASRYELAELTNKEFLGIRGIPYSKELFELIV